MTSRGYDPRQSPGLGYKRVVSCKDSFHGTDVLAGSEHGAPDASGSNPGPDLVALLEGHGPARDLPFAVSRREAVADAELLREDGHRLG